MNFGKSLIIGWTGTVSQAYMRSLKKYSSEIIGISRKSSDINIDIDLMNQDVTKVIREVKPNLIIKCAGLVSPKECEENSLKAEKINAKLVQDLALCCEENQCKLLHVNGPFLRW